MIRVLTEKKNIKIYILTLLLLVNYSCTSKFYITLDVLRPAQVEFSKSANNLLIVNNTTPQPDTLGHTFKLFNDLTFKNDIPLDSSSYFYLNALNDEILSREFFSTVHLVDNSINENENFEEIIPLQYKRANELGTEYEADVILSLDYFYIHDELSEFYWEEPESYEMVLEAQYQAMWSIHYPGTLQITPILLRDTLFGESGIYWHREEGNLIINRKELLLDGALTVGMYAADYFIPYWDQDDRYFYCVNNNKYMKEAIDYVYSRAWGSAIELWKKAIEETTRNKIKAYSANNIAIAYEVLGDIDKAIQYIDYSIELVNFNSFFDVDSLIAYKENLQKRKNEIERLSKQLEN